MIRLVQKQEIILKHFREGKSQRDINRETGISRKTIRKYIRKYEEQKQAILDGDLEDKEVIHDFIAAPKYDSSNRVRKKLTDEIIDRIHFFIRENEKKKSTGRSKQQKKKIDIYECLIEEGHDISYSTVCNYIRKYTETSKEAHVRQEYQPGEICEFDWGYVHLTIDGKPKVIQMAAFTGAKGNYRYANLYHNQKMENFLDVHVKFFNEIKGVYQTVVYDNMKVAVKRFVSRTQKEATEDLLKLSLYYGFRYRFCNVCKGNEKGHVERSIEYIRRKAFSKRDTFDSLEQANQYLKETLEKLNARPTEYNEEKSPADILEEEKPYLLEWMPSYDTARTCELRVNKYAVVSIDENKYSVPDDLVGRFVFAKIYPEKILLYHQEKLIAEHRRSYGAHTWSINIHHYLNTIKKKPGSLHSSTAMQQMNPTLQSIYHTHYTENPKDFIDLLELIGEKGLEKIQSVIQELEKLNPTSVNTEKIKMLCQRKDPEGKSLNQERTTEIEEKSKIILNHYGHLLKPSCVAFHKEAKII
ncbi:Homeodomain-like domain-containing protein [Tindallia magadiensis]|uniref:Homeodomain-like domain-containing protein n=1 Tax=Tindallia magadiensis TaxID=69895 RepID=A0A1I3I0A3_9FIRM|nr:IS21 family transposase [Tindallia magadiensis]SFI41371.1 Homeodomain-like domain-containing protein [Tindallia magadiensis]